MERDAMDGSMPGHGAAGSLVERRDQARMDRKAQLPKQQRQRARTSARHDRSCRRQEARTENYGITEPSSIERVHASPVLPADLAAMQLHTQKVLHSRRIRRNYNPSTMSRVSPGISGAGLYMTSGKDRFYKPCNFLSGRLRTLLKNQTTK